MLDLKKSLMSMILFNQCIYLFQDKPGLDKINESYDFVYDVPNEKYYDRIISVAVLEHVTDLPDVIAKNCTLLEIDGVFQAGILSEGESYG